ncbi:hypothetical protein KSF_058140 [Reticulibacter mediterranei]|uniref:Uncharacterized protein n=1 Tax=Reticulibacter mediterranei TaxID=2778369 RepID=A0A8J3IV04_9CHLR|nr:hypothetical protein [Reticulibacter mediterranei]GHO95766.1 hypothetical protein KSF_058140 [Reticulibacter mediterranei]
MTIANLFVANYSSSQALVDVEGMAQQGIHAIFRARSVAKTPRILNQIERRERAILLLMDGKRTLQDVARLTRRHELEIAWILVHLLERGYIEFLGAEEDINNIP